MLKKIVDWLVSPATTNQTTIVESTEEPVYTGDTSTISCAIEGGNRQSQNQGVTLGSVMSQYYGVEPDFPRKIGAVIARLCMYNADFSLALENIVTLSNTEFDLEFEGVSDKQTKQVLQNQKYWYSNGGINGLRNDLFTQLVVHGVISAEIIPSNSLKDVYRVVLVAPETIVFKRSSETGEYEPWQNINGKSIKLNTATYKYTAFRRFSEKPYGVPLYLAALESVVIERSMAANMTEIIRKLGILGFMEVLLEQPGKLTVQNGGRNETDSQYASRMQGILSDAKVAMENGISNGFLIGFKGKHEFDMKDTTANVAGAESLIRLNTETKHTGLKQNPFLLGKNYSTTETLANVILTILAAQVKNYQGIIDSFLEQVYELDLELSGAKNYTVTIASVRPLITDQSKEQTTFSTKIDNYDKLYKQGVISQEQRAQALDYETPFLPKPLEDTDSDNSIDVNADDEVLEKNHKVGIEQLYSKYTEYDYDTEYSNSVESYAKIMSFEAGDELLNERLEKYLFDTKTNYNKALRDVMRQLGESLGKSLDRGDVLSAEAVLNKAYYTLYTAWGEKFITPQFPITSKNVENSYKLFRKDKGVFGADAEKIPNAIFNTIDFRTIEYMKEMDDVYLGKFITDASTRKKVNEFIRKEYLEGGKELGSKSAIDKFTKEFGTLLKGEDWKIDQIVSTTISRMRYGASLQYMDQAEITKYIRVSIGDRLRCGYCAELDGKKFILQDSLDTFNSAINGGVEQVGTMNPFVTKIYPRFQDMAGVSVKDLQANGAEVVPSHPRCRCTVVAVL